MKVRNICLALILVFLEGWCASAISSAQDKEVNLPSSKVLLPVPGGPQPTNSLPTAVALSPDGKYLAILNNGYGTAESKFQQSIALLDLASNKLRDFPDPRLALHARQSYFLGLVWSSDGASLYASMGSLTDPEGKNPGDTGNGVAVYRLAERHAGGPTLSEAAACAPRSRPKVYLQSEECCARLRQPVSGGTGCGEARRRRRAADRGESCR